MRNNHLPFVSIIIPVYNGEKTIGKCIESLLNQDYPKDKYEIIIVDNKSRDKTEKIIKQYPVTYIQEGKSQNSYTARNTGAQVSKGEALIFFDDDQIAESNWVTALLKSWGEKQYAAFGGRRIAVPFEDNVAGIYWKQTAIAKPSKLMFECKNFTFIKASCGNVAYRREAFEKLGGFDTRFFSLGDYDLALRLQKDLGYSIKHNFEAITYHYGRPDWKSLLKAEFRMGFGRCLLEQKHRECKTSLVIQFLKATKRTIFGLAAIMVGIFKVPQGKEKRAHLLTIFLDIGMFWTRLLGRIQGIITKGRRLFPAHW